MSNEKANSIKNTASTVSIASSAGLLAAPLTGGTSVLLASASLALSGACLKYYSRALRKEWDQTHLSRLKKVLLADAELSQKLQLKLEPIISGYVSLRASGIDPLQEEKTITGTCQQSTVTQKLTKKNSEALEKKGLCLVDNLSSRIELGNGKTENTLELSSSLKSLRKTGKICSTKLRRSRAVAKFIKGFGTIGAVVTIGTNIADIIHQSTDSRFFELINLIESAIEELEENRDLVHSVVNQTELML